MSDRHYFGLPWKAGGRTRAGVDCAGLVALFLKLPELPAAAPGSEALEKFVAEHHMLDSLRRGDVVFFRERRTRRIAHVGVWLGDGQLLHILQGCVSRSDRGFELLHRIGLDVAGAVNGAQTAELARALADPALGQAILIPLIIGLALSAATMMFAPKVGRLREFKAKQGIYSDNALVTQKNPELPLPELLGRCTLAGNQVYQELRNQSEASTATDEMWNQILVLSSGPVQEIERAGMKINNVPINDGKWYDDVVTGIQNPAQTKALAVTGDFGGTKGAPTLTIYDGAHAIAVPVDVRAQYDRSFPVYGFAGCAYAVLRASNSSTFSSLNFTVRVSGLKLRTFSAAGFDVTTATGESLTGADGSKVRFKLAFDDIVAVSALTVNAASYAPISASAQTGDKYQLNATKGFVEFITAPANGATISITYTYHPRSWTRNPAAHLLHLLTGSGSGFGLDESVIDWDAFHTFYDHCSEEITVLSDTGPVTGPRWVTDYAVDERRPVPDHLQFILDGCHALLFESNGKIKIKSLAVAESSLFSFTAANILSENGISSLTVESVDRRPNRIRLFYQSEESLNSENEVMAEDETEQEAMADLIGNEGVISDDLKLVAVTSRAQAERLGEVLVRESVGSKNIFSWKTDVQGLALEPGDLVDILHAGLGITTAVTVRIIGIEHDADDRLKLSAATYVNAAYF